MNLNTEVSTVYVSVGSNIRRRTSIRGGLKSLKKRFAEIQLSSVYETEAVGFDGDAFYNLVLSFETTLSPQVVNRYLKEIEAIHGREKGGKKFSPRTLDIDLLLYDDIMLDIPGLQIPRDEIFKYAFVLEPLAEMVPNAICPGQPLTYKELWEAFYRKENPVKATIVDWDPLGNL